MSLIVSLRIPDGIVIAADSMSTSHTILKLVAPDIGITCPNCNKKITEQELRVPPIFVPFSASSYTQKLFSLYNKYAISSFGEGIINNRSIYFHVKHFENIDSMPKDLEDIKNKFINYLENELIVQYPKYKTEAPKEWHPIGFHINGYEYIDNKPSGVTYEIFIGRENIIHRRDIIGCTIGGDTKVVMKLWEIGKADQRLIFKYRLFSLQDAVDLSEFLINTTSTFQRFANEVQTVGGEVDIALLHPISGFQWIKRKKLMETLEGRNKNESEYKS